MFVDLQEPYKLDLLSLCKPACQDVFLKTCILLGPVVSRLLTIHLHRCSWKSSSELIHHGYLSRPAPSQGWTQARVCLGLQNHTHSIRRPGPLSVPQAEESLNYRKPVPWSTATCLTSWAQSFLYYQRRYELIGSPFSQTLIVPRWTSVMCQPKNFLRNVCTVKSGQLLRAQWGWSPVVSGRFITNFLSKRLEVSPNLIAECQGW